MSEPRLQCEHCPWKRSTVPERDIPGGYSAELHRGLAGTIAQPGDLRSNGRAMACHESRDSAPPPCVGWMHNQLGAGNNLALRMAVIAGKIDGNVEVVGPQHERFEDTLPRGEA